MNLALSATPRIVAEALRLRGRRRPSNPRKSNNNYIAERRSTSCYSAIKPVPVVAAKRKRRRRPGAPRGNRNSLKTGLYTAEMKARRAYLHSVMARLRLARALAKQLRALKQVHAQVLDI